VADDLRVPLDPIFATFGVPATVTRPAADPIATTGIWVPEAAVEAFADADFGRRETRRVMAFRRDQVASLPKGTLVLAAETAGGDTKRFRVDGTERQDSETHHVYLVPDPE